METFPTFDKRRAFNKAVGPRKKCYEICKTALLGLQTKRAS